MSLERNQHHSIRASNDERRDLQQWYWWWWSSSAAAASCSSWSIDVDELKKAITFTLDVLIFIFNILLFTVPTQTYRETILLETWGSSNAQNNSYPQQQNKTQVESKHYWTSRSQLAARIMWSQPKLIWTRYVCLDDGDGNKKKVSTISHPLAITITSRSRSSAAAAAAVGDPLSYHGKRSEFDSIHLSATIVTEYCCCLDLYRHLVIIDCCAASSSCSLWLKLLDWMSCSMHCVRLIECNRNSLNIGRGSSNELSITR